MLARFPPIQVSEYVNWHEQRLGVSNLVSRTAIVEWVDEMASFLKDEILFPSTEFN